MLLHYLGKLKMQLLCRYSAHIEENANKPWEIKNATFMQIFSTYRRKCKQTAFYSLYLSYSSTNFDIFSA